MAAQGCAAGAPAGAGRAGGLVGADAGEASPTTGVAASCVMGNRTALTSSISGRTRPEKPLTWRYVRARWSART